MLVKIRDVDVRLVLQLQDMTATATASKAFLRAAREYIVQEEKIKQQEAIIQTLAKALSTAQELFDSLNHPQIDPPTAEPEATGKTSSLKDMAEWFESQPSLDLVPGESAEWEEIVPVGREFGSVHNPGSAKVKGREPGSS